MGQLGRRVVGVAAAPDLVENIFAQPRLHPIVIGNAVHHGYGFALSTPGEQEFGRFKKVKKEEAAYELQRIDELDGSFSK